MDHRVGAALPQNGGRGAQHTKEAWIMTRKLAAVLFGLVAMGAAQGPPQSFEATSTELVDFPGGAIHVDNSYGYLTVAGWDEPKVEIVVTKSTNRFYQPERKEKALRSFGQIRVVAERRSDTELAISTKLPIRHGFPFSILPLGRVSHRGVTVEYTLHVPRDSRVVIHHDFGYVWVSDVRGGVEVDSHTGDMTVMLPDPGPYSIDAKTGMGSITSDLMGRGNKRFPIGSHFVHTGQAPSRRIYLRMGRGCITIKNGPPSGPFRQD
jgi:hypothetical protein